MCGTVFALISPITRSPADPSVFLLSLWLETRFFPLSLSLSPRLVFLLLLSSLRIIYNPARRCGDATMNNDSHLSAVSAAPRGFTRVCPQMDYRLKAGRPFLIHRLLVVGRQALSGAFQSVSVFVRPALLMRAGNKTGSELFFVFCFFCSRNVYVRFERNDSSKRNIFVSVKR